jgi:ABC-type lipoprotein export system ATPase subunit
VLLRAEGLVKSYRAPSGATLAVLAGVDLKVASGELLAILGASGSGKSTLLNVLGLLEDPDAGNVWFGDQRVTGLGRSARSRVRGRRVGFVFQSFMLLPSLTALDNVLLAARYAGKPGPATERRALELLEGFGMLERRDHYPPQLSGGEQQRIAFCRALLNDPPILLADEPTGNLDEGNARVILEALRYRARGGAAVVLVSHSKEVAAVATAVLSLDRGTLR